MKEYLSSDNRINQEKERKEVIFNMSKRRLAVHLLLFCMIVFASITMNMEFQSIRVEASSKNTKVKAPTLKEKKKELYVGGTTYQVKLNDVGKSASITYKSSKTSIAKVSKKGVITPLKEGNVTITVAVKQNKKNYNLKLAITVKKPSIKLTNSTNYLNVGEFYSFKGKLVGMKGKISWSTSDKKVATISSSGVLRAVAPGNVVVSAKVGKMTVIQKVVIGENRIGTFANEITIYDKYTLWVSVNDLLADEELSITNANSKVLNIGKGQWSEDKKMQSIDITPNTVGEDTITIASTKTKDKLIVKIKVVEKPSSQKLSAKEIYSHCGNSVVEINVETSYSTSQGSGFHIGNGMVVTNNHVIEEATKITVTSSDNKKYQVKEILGFSYDLDIAILSTEITGEALTLSKDKVSVGENIYALGSPLGLTGTMSSGIVSTDSRIIDQVDYIQITAPISPGNSGGPLINEYGEVVGINTMHYIDGQSLNFAVNIGELAKISTNLPMTIQEYAEYGDKRYAEEYEKNKIFEDPTLSQNSDTCQNLPSFVGLEGAINPSEYGDLYWFYLSEETYLIGGAYFDTIQASKDTFVDIFDSSYEYLFGFEYSDDEEGQYIMHYLEAGLYYIMVYTGESYTGESLNYELLLIY